MLRTVWGPGLLAFFGGFTGYAQGGRCFWALCTLIAEKMILKENKKGGEGDEETRFSRRPISPL